MSLGKGPREEGLVVHEHHGPRPLAKPAFPGPSTLLVLAEENMAVISLWSATPRPKYRNFDGTRETSPGPPAIRRVRTAGRRDGGIELYNNFLYDGAMLHQARAGESEAGDLGRQDLAAVARSMQEAKGALSAVEAEALVGIAKVLAETADSLARTAERLDAMRPAEWMDAEQTAAYLADRSRDSFDKVAPMLPKHCLTERRPLYNRREIDEWLMSR